MSRGKRCVDLCTSIITDVPQNSFQALKNPEDFWKTERKKIWFCNRALSPFPPTNNSNDGNDAMQSSTVSSDDACDTNDTQESLQEFGKTTVSPSSCDMFAGNDTTKTGNNIIILQNVRIEPPKTYSHYSPGNEVVPQDLQNASSICDSEVLNRKQEYPPEQIKINDNYSFLQEGYSVVSETPDDPFQTDSDSSYIPEDEDEDSPTADWAPRRTRSTKNNSRIGLLKTNEKVIIETVLTDSKPSLSEDHETHFPNTKPSTSQNLESKFLALKPVISNNHYIRKPDYCYFCETVVQNFVRHIKRNHSTETAVVEIFSKPTKSKERRSLLDKLRRKGNFLGSGQNQQRFKVVRESYVPNRTTLPCDNCLGFFSSKILYRHRKKCTNGNGTGTAQAAGQAKMVLNARVDPRLKQEVFPHMRADKLSLEAQNDTLICAFGSRYQNTHREKHFVAVTSRKMRELAKILIEVRKLDPSITTLFSALRPENFDYFVEAAKRLGKYDEKTEIFLSPTIAMNIATSLKQCCEIAITYAYKKHTGFSVDIAKAEANLKTLITLFQTNWRFEIATAAANNLHLNRWNKITIVPLASDLKLLKNHLVDIADKSLNQLKRNNNPLAFNTLMETIYCRVILLNRKRSGELERMFLHTYLNSSSPKDEYEEFNKVVSSVEQILLKTLKRVVIRGKRGRGVPVLFSVDVQNHLKFLTEVRDVYVPKENKYLFAKADSHSHLIGYKTLNKYAKNCGAKNPSSITSTRLRKHLATLSQLFNLTNQEIEQLATFMGHTPGVHRNSYRLPDDVFQTAKISKLLLVMEKGGANQYQGKSLDEMNIDMEKNLLSDNEESEKSDCEDVISQNSPEASVPTPVETSNISAIIPKKGKYRTLVPWSREQKQIVKEFFAKHIRAKTAPKRSECEELKAKYSELLQNKDWLKIKVFIQNEYKKKYT